MAENTPQVLEQADVDYLLGVGEHADDTRSVEDAAIRPEAAQGFDPSTEAKRQAGIAAADRVLRAEAGLDPRVHNLK